MQCLYGCVLSGTKASKQTLLELPSNVVEGSVRSFVTIVGEFIDFLCHSDLKILLEVIYKKS